MEIRRIQITGGSSFMVTLPKDWAEARGLKKNDPVAVVPQPDGSLLLSANGGTEGKESTKVLDVDDFETPESLYRCLIGSYIAGHDQIVLKSDTSIKGTFLEVISEFTQTSMGMEIVEEEEDRITIKDLIDHSEVIPIKNVRREYLLVKRMVVDAFSSSRPSVEEIVSRDTEVDRIHWLVQRQASIHQMDIGLGSRMGIRLGTVTSCMGVSRILERMGDHAVLVVKNLHDLEIAGISVGDNILGQVGDALISYIETAMHSWLDADCGMAEAVICRKKEVLRILEGCFTDLPGETSVRMLQGSVTRIVEYCSDIAESAINVSMENE